MTLYDFKKIYAQHSPCDDGRDKFEQCKTRQEAYNIAASPLGSDFLVRAINDGWGPTPDDIYEVFHGYINGRKNAIYSTEDKKIAAQIWCKSSSLDIDQNVRWATLIDCHGSLTVKPWQVLKLIVDKRTDITIKGSSNAIICVENYGGIIFDEIKKCRIVEK